MYSAVHVSFHSTVIYMQSYFKDSLDHVQKEEPQTIKLDIVNLELHVNIHVYVLAHTCMDMLIELQEHVQCTMYPSEICEPSNTCTFFINTFYYCYSFCQLQIVFFGVNVHVQYRSNVS